MISHLRTAALVVAGLAAAAGGGVAVHAATSSSSAPTTPAAATASPTPNAGARTACRSPFQAAGAAVLRIAATQTGLTQADILTQLRSGRTLDQIAGDKASAIEDQAVAQLKQRLDAAVSSGKITADRETAMLAQARKRLDTLMSKDLSKLLARAGTACSAKRGPLSGLLADLIKVTAQQTGLTEQQVKDQLRSGKSIDDIAGSKAAAIKQQVLSDTEQKISAALDKLMARTPKHRPAAQATPTPAI